MITETITWHVLAENPKDLPDADLTVVIELDPAGDASEPVWLGFFDGSGWLDAMGDAVQVIAWADMPKGTAGVRDRFGDADLAPGNHGGTVAVMPSGVALPRDDQPKGGA